MLGLIFIILYQDGAAGGAVSQPCSCPCSYPSARPNTSVARPSAAAPASAASFWDVERTATSTSICTTSFRPQHATHPTAWRHAATYWTSSSTGDFVYRRRSYLYTKVKVVKANQVYQCKALLWKINKDHTLIWHLFTTSWMQHLTKLCCFDHNLTLK